MTTNQEYFLGLYADNANKAYSLMHEAKVDYDTYKPIVDASLLKTEQAKKMFDKLYVVYINYPVFLKGLKKIYDNAKEQSDIEAFYLKEALDKLNSLKAKYDSWIDKLNALQIQIDEDLLSQDIQYIADDPQSLIKSDELVLQKKKADDAAIQAAAEKAAAEAANAPQVIATETGTEACVDKDGNLIDMSICRPSSSGGGGIYTPHIDTASEIVSKNVDSWLDNIINQVSPKVTPPPPIIAPSAQIETLKDKKLEEPTIQQKIAENEEAAAKEAAEKEEAAVKEAAAAAKEAAEKESDKKEEAQKEIYEVPTTEDVINSFIFNVDLSKLISDKTTETELQPEPQPEPQPEYDSLGLGLGSGGPIPMGGGVAIFDTFSPILPQPEPQIIKIEPEPEREIKKSNSIFKTQQAIVDDVKKPILQTAAVNTTNMKPIYIGAGVVAALIVYKIWKKKS
jgi:hypothetical protein